MYLESSGRAGGSVEQPLASTIEQDGAASAARPQVVAGTLSAGRVIVAGLRVHVVVVSIRLAHDTADWGRGWRRLLLPRAVSGSAEPAVQTTEASREHVAHCAQVDQHQGNPGQRVHYRDQATPDRARRYATVS